VNTLKTPREKTKSLVFACETALFAPRALRQNGREITPRNVLARAQVRKVSARPVKGSFPNAPSAATRPDLELEEIPEEDSPLEDQNIVGR
jgi:hypothetical protein